MMIQHISNTVTHMHNVRAPGAGGAAHTYLYAHALSKPTHIRARTPPPKGGRNSFNRAHNIAHVLGASPLHAVIINDLAVDTPRLRKATHSFQPARLTNISSIWVYHLSKSVPHYPTR